MKIVLKRGYYSTAVSVVHEGTTIELDSLYEGTDSEDFAEHLIDVGFELLPNNEAIFNYLKKNGYWDDIKEQITYEEECEEE